jgi:pyruvate formate lyase activating enzyme
VNTTALPRPDGFAEPLSGRRVRCKACQRRCLLEEGQLGYCGVRTNENGMLRPLSYGRVAAMHLADVERKPLYHFFPGTIMLSLGSLGCNYRCAGCQNRELAHAEVPDELSRMPYVSPEELAEKTLKEGLLGISFTYNEPALWFEYTLDTCRLAKTKDLATNYVTNGSLTPEALDEIGPYLDAYRVDIKGFSQQTYQRVANFPEFGGILDVAVRAKRKWGMHVECVTNIIPTVNDEPAELRGIARWIAGELGTDVPWHVTRFVPYGDFGHLPSTPVATLDRARSIGMEEGLKFVYVGNVPGHPAQSTYCPDCGRVLVRRTGLGASKILLTEGACPDCGYRLPGRFGWSRRLT